MSNEQRMILKRFLAPFYSFKRRFPLATYITNRLLTMAVMLFLLGLAVFALMALAPGDIVDQIMLQQLMGGNEAKGGRDNKNFSAEQLAAYRAEFGLDKPFYVQYFRWLNRVILHGDLGVSLISRAPVSFFDLLAPVEFASIKPDFAGADHGNFIRPGGVFFHKGGNQNRSGGHIHRACPARLSRPSAFDTVAVIRLGNGAFPGNGLSALPFLAGPG